MARMGAGELEPALRSIATGRPFPRLDAAHRRGRRRDAPAGGALNRLRARAAAPHCTARFTGVRSDAPESSSPVGLVILDRARVEWDGRRPPQRSLLPEQPAVAG